MINFIVPSIGRPTLKSTLQSLINQTNPNWECWVGFDGLSKNQVEDTLLINDSRIHYLFSVDKVGEKKHHGNAGLVRNWIISNINNNYEWIGFVDDDDTLSSDYIERLIQNINYTDFDCCVFRMRYDAENIKIIPPLNMVEIRQNYVGISFCVKRNFIIDSNIKFINSNSEDYQFLENIHLKGGIIYLSEYITYNVNGHMYG